MLFIKVLIAGVIEFLIGAIILTVSIITILEIAWFIEPPNELDKTVITGVYAQIILMMYIYISMVIGERFILWAIKKVENKIKDCKV